MSGMMVNYICGQISPDSSEIKTESQKALNDSLYSKQVMALEIQFLHLCHGDVLLWGYFGIKEAFSENGRNEVLHLSIS